MNITNEVVITDQDIENILDNYNSNNLSGKRDFDTIQKFIIKNMESIDFRAVPGSGKTTLLAFKIALLLNKWPYFDRGICILSHTNVAKDIIQRELSKINKSYNLNTFPHFVGTIQHFIDQFIAIPYLTSLGIKVQHIDTDIFYNKLRNLLIKEIGITKYSNKELYIKQKGWDLLKLIPHKDQYNNVLKRLKGKKQEYINFLNKCFCIYEALKKDGFLRYEDMMSYSQEFIEKYPKILKILKYRFPFVIVDEAQDNNSFHNNILDNIFYKDQQVENVYQRIGDIDQSIYDMWYKGECHNLQRNKDSMFIHKSKRFGSNIAREVNKYKYENVDIEGVINRKLDVVKDIIFPLNEPNKAIDEFVDLVLKHKDNLPPNPIIKIIGAQGENKDISALVIKKYIKNFESKTNIKRQIVDIYTIIRKIIQNKENSFANKYEDFINSLFFVSIFKKRSDFNRFIKDKQLINSINRFLLKYRKSIILPTREEFLKDLQQSINIDFDKKKLNNNISENPIPKATNIEIHNQDIKFIDNSFTYKGLKFCVSTIHGVKGETHDATLVLSTKNWCRGYNSDIQYVRDRIGKKVCEKQKRLIYVATSRPRYILALAIPKI